ncbi:MAG: hypothetical protein V4537_05455 [Pseudomonadota bacterium]
MSKTLGQFSITREADGYVLHLEDDDGETVEYSATVDQLDEITMAIEDLEVIDEDDPALASDDEDDVLGETE